MLVYYLGWHMRRAWAPMPFDDDDPAAAEAERRSVVAPAQRSPRSKAEALTNRTAEGEPVHSLQSSCAICEAQGGFSRRAGDGRRRKGEEPEQVE